MIQRVSSQLRRAAPHAFTLIELLVVVAVIVLLIGILIPALGHVRRAGLKATTLSQLNSIRMGIAQYYSDFSVYPSSSAGPLGGPGAFNGGIQPGRGAAMLAEALLGYLSYDRDGAGPINANGSPSNSGDPPYGFRNQRFGNTPTGKIYGPYVAAEPGKNMKQNLGLNDTSFIDGWGNEILYYRSTRSLPGTSMDTVGRIFGKYSQNDTLFYEDDCAMSNNLTPPRPPQGLQDPIPNPTPNTVSPDDQAKFLNALNVPRGPMGNAIISGSILGSNSFLLISAGEDGKYYQGGDDLIMTKQ